MQIKPLDSTQEMGAPPPHDPAVFNDPLALTVPWTPLHPGGTNFRTHKLHQTLPGHWEFRAGIGTIIFCGFFALVGLAILTVSLVSLPKSDGISWVPILMGGVFTAVGIGLGYYFTLPAVFSLDHGYFHKGRKNPQHIPDRSKLGSYCELRDIHALQILREHISSGKGGSYPSYELNLVLSDGSRLNVIDHGNLQAIRGDAQALAGFIGKPVWDAA